MIINEKNSYKIIKLNYFWYKTAQIIYKSKAYFPEIINFNYFWYEITQIMYKLIYFWQETKKMTRKLFIFDKK